MSNQQIENLNRIAAAPVRTILGVMSGTSMDGVDLALCRIKGASFSTELELLEFDVADPGAHIRERFQKLAFGRDLNLAGTIQFERELEEVWIDLILKQLDLWKIQPDQVDLLASHGQTIFHKPDRNSGLHSTLQLVDGDRLAAALGVTTVSDFRQKHIAAGYEGAPLAPLAELLLFSHPRIHRLFLNLGGIANITVLRAAEGTNPKVPFATDTGPANTLLDAAAQRLLPGKDMDEDGEVARSGRVNHTLLEKLMTHPFFRRREPASTGPEEFSWEWVYRTMLETAPDLQTPDLLATLVELTALSVSHATERHIRGEPAEIVVSGGGIHNRCLMDRLAKHLHSYQIRSSEELGVRPDAKEAALFAVLANEAVAGRGWISDSGERFTVGKISLPNE